MAYDIIYNVVKACKTAVEPSVTCGLPLYTTDLVDFSGDGLQQCGATLHPNRPKNPLRS